MTKPALKLVVDNTADEPEFKDGDGGDVFVAGDVVFLVSGSPPLTVLANTPDGVMVGWFRGCKFDGTVLPENVLVLDGEAE